MSDSNNSSAIPTWFWVVTILALVWNLMGVMAYIEQVTLTAEALAAMSEAERSLYQNTPAWANGAFAIAVFGGTMGCVLLMLKNAAATITLIVSFVAIIVQMGHAFFLSNSFEVFGPGGFIMPVMVIVIAGLLIWFAKSSEEKGWIS